jgi:hypothetical protein
MRRTHTQLKDGGIVLKLNSKNLSTYDSFFLMEGLLVSVCRIGAKKDAKKDVEMSIWLNPN